MDWSITNLIIEIIAGIVGAHAAGAAAKEYSLGAIGNTLLGAIAGALSGTFFQVQIGTLVNETGEIQPPPNQATEWVLQVLGGLGAGGVLTLVAGFIKQSIEQHKSGSSR